VVKLRALRRLEHEESSRDEKYMKNFSRNFWR